MQIVVFCAYFIFKNPGDKWEETLHPSWQTCGGPHGQQTSTAGLLGVNSTARPVELLKPSEDTFHQSDTDLCHLSDYICTDGGRKKRYHLFTGRKKKYVPNIYMYLKMDFFVKRFAVFCHLGWYAVCPKLTTHSVRHFNQPKYARIMTPKNK